MIVEENMITIHEIEHTSSPCHCLCDYPTTATLGPFEDDGHMLRLELYANERRPYDGDTLVIFPYAAVILATIGHSFLGGIQ